MQTQVLRISSAQARQESGVLKISDEERFVVALKELKLKDMSYEDVKKPLKYAMLLVGLRESNLPNEMELRIIINHAQNQYGNHTATEVRLAFDLAVADKLDIKEVSCYENFSCLYFSSIMNAYRSWAKEIYKEADKPPLKQLSESTEPFTDEEKVETSRKLYKLLKTYRCITQEVVKILYRDKKIEKPNDEDTAQIMKQATTDYHLEVREGNFSYADKEKEIKKICNQILVAKYFNEI